MVIYYENCTNKYTINLGGCYPPLGTFGFSDITFERCLPT